MRSSDRKDIFADRFTQLTSNSTNGSGANLHKATNSDSSYSSFEEGLLMRRKDKERAQLGDGKGRRENGVRPRADTESSTSTSSATQSSQSQGSPTDSSFTLGGSAVWVGDESGLELAKDGTNESNTAASLASTSTISSSRKRRSTGASSSSSAAHSREHHARQINASQSYYDAHLRHAMVKDTHFYHTTVTYRDHPLPIKMPLATFSEEVGDVCRLTPFLLSPADIQLLVFPDIFDQSVQLSPAGFGAGAPTSTYQRTAHTPNHHSFQRFNYREAYHLFGSQAPSWRCVKLCSLGVRSCLWVWCGASRFH